MTELQREVFILMELEQLTAREVAEQIQIAEAAVVSRLRRAREVFYEFCQSRADAARSPQTSNPSAYDA